MAFPQQDLEKLLSAPALEPPPGVQPQFENPPNENPLAWGVTTFCMVIATLCLFLRAYGRIWLERKGAYWGTAYAAYALTWTPGYYVHTWDLVNGDLVRPLYLILVYGCCYSAVLPLIKTAILLDWCRIFVPGDKLKSPFWWGAMTIVFVQCIWGVLCVTLLNLQCRPHYAIWEFYVSSKCYDLPKVMLASASVQVISDIAMVLLPQRIIWSLHMKWQRKIGIVIIFGVGVIACVAACFRLAHTVTFSKEADTMWYIGPLLFWACGEMTCGFFILSVTTLPRIVAESGLSSKLKKVLGISLKSSGPSNLNVDNEQSPRPLRLSRSGKSSDNYYRLDEDGIPMTILDKSESQEKLNDKTAYSNAHKNAVHVTRETQITVTSTPNTNANVDQRLTPWERQESC
ncbi:hypothetical protein NW762_013997 [Fusarium torreyae]|uniref:Rhodopsin domain-containing protein n=1 Tax=Fusarium torreyae TaxID=1237075 RepID=A0A9W8V9S6_9HYPO|nr:hypothetical protein NW762_013997 [Fusarium torreyae]